MYANKVKFIIIKSGRAKLSLFNIENLIENKVFYMSLINIIKTTILQRELIKDIVFKDLEDRLKSFLQNLGNEQDEFIKDKQVLTIPFSVKILSELVGFERQSVSTMLNKLIKDEKLQKILKNYFLINQNIQ